MSKAGAGQQREEGKSWAGKFHPRSHSAPDGAQLSQTFSRKNGKTSIFSGAQKSNYIIRLFSGLNSQHDKSITSEGTKLETSGCSALEANLDSFLNFM